MERKQIKKKFIKNADSNNQKAIWNSKWKVFDITRREILLIRIIKSLQQFELSKILKQVIIYNGKLSKKI